MVLYEEEEKALGDMEFFHVTNAKEEKVWEEETKSRNIIEEVDGKL